jgi:hypothetical protein
VARPRIGERDCRFDVAQRYVRPPHPGPIWPGPDLEDPERSYHASHRTTDHDLFDNWLIFGDNLLALKALEQEFAGKIKSQYDLGAMCAHGMGVTPDLGEAAEWFRKATAQGHPHDGLAHRLLALGW